MNAAGIWKQSPHQIGYPTSCHNCSPNEVMCVSPSLFRRKQMKLAFLLRLSKPTIRLCGKRAGSVFTVWTHTNEIFWQSVRNKTAGRIDGLVWSSLSLFLLWRSLVWKRGSKESLRAWGSITRSKSCNREEVANDTSHILSPQFHPFSSHSPVIRIDFCLPTAFCPPKEKNCKTCGQIVRMLIFETPFLMHLWFA